MGVFSERFMKYWYGAALIIVVFFTISMANDASVRGYELTVYNPEGTIEQTDTIVANTISEKELEGLPVPKLFVPIKRF